MATVALISIGHINRELESPNGLLNIGNAEGPAYALCQMSVCVCVCVCERERELEQKSINYCWGRQHFAESQNI